MNLRNYAYIGDAVWELYVREKTVKMTNNSQHLHEITTKYVKAAYQAELLKNIELSDVETEIARRARNLPIPVARRANQAEYRQATAFETLIGWWYYYDKARLETVLNNCEIM